MDADAKTQYLHRLQYILGSSPQHQFWK